MPRVYADLPKFKRIHQALMETARQHQVTIREIDKTLSVNRTTKEKAELEQLRRQCTDSLKRQLDVTASFGKKIASGRNK